MRKPRVVTIELVPLDGAARAGSPAGRGLHDLAAGGQRQSDGDVRRSLTRDEGVVCGDRCTYLWNFGPDAATKTGRIVTLAFPSAGTRTVTLFVTDERGFTSTRTQSVSIVAPGGAGCAASS